jgi:hypothetical protein
MPFELMAIQPFLCHFPVFFSPTGKKGNDMAFIIPPINGFKSILKWFTGFHSFGLFIRHIFCDRTIYVDEKVLYVFRKYWANALAILPFRIF